MKTRIVVPVENEDGLEAPIAKHFGRSRFFVVVDLDEEGKVVFVKTEVNTGEHHGGIGNPHGSLLSLQPNVIIAYGIGPGGLENFSNAGVNVLKANANTIEETINQFKAGKLEKLTGGCEHAHLHHHH